MFEKIAKFRLLRTRRVAPAPERRVPANDNRPGAVRPGRRRPQLVCRWSFDQGPSCRWEIAGPREANPLLAEEPPAAGTFTQLSSYRRTTNRLPPASRNGRGQSSTAPNLLQARHWPAVIDDEQGPQSCNCKSFANKVARDFKGLDSAGWSHTVLLKGHTRDHFGNSFGSETSANLMMKETTLATKKPAR